MSAPISRRSANALAFLAGLRASQQTGVSQSEAVYVTGTAGAATGPRVLGITRAGVGPAPSGAIVRAQYIIVSDASTGGVFVYDGTPGPDNPPVYTITNSTTDPYGNKTYQGITAASSSGTHVQLADLNGVPALILSTGSSEEDLPAFAEVFAQNNVLYFVIQGPEMVDYPDSAGIVLQSSASTGGTAYAGGNLVYTPRDGATYATNLEWGEGGVIVNYATTTANQPGTTLTNETWHYVGTSGEPSFSGTWTNHGSTAAKLAFKKLAESDMVAITGAIVPGTGNAAPVFTLPADYIPDTTQFITGSNFTSGGSCFLQVNYSTGIVDFGGQSQVSTDIYVFSGVYPMGE